jgi:hypothetical protein
VRRKRGEGSCAERYATVSEDYGAREFQRTNKILPNIFDSHRLNGHNMNGDDYNKNKC